MGSILAMKPDEGPRGLSHARPKRIERTESRSTLALRAAFQRREIECRAKALERLKEMGWEGFEPRSSIEEFLRNNLLRQAEKLERVIDVRTARRARYVEQAAARELDDADRLGRTLLRDPRGPAGKYSLRRSILNDAEAREGSDLEQVDPGLLLTKLQTSAGRRAARDCSASSIERRLGCASYLWTTRNGPTARR